MVKSILSACKFAAAVAFCFLISSCDKNNGVQSPVELPSVDFFALTKDNTLQLVNSKNASAAISSVTITGLQSGETLAGIDFRPNTGQLFGVGSTSRLYTINTSTGVATAVGTSPFSPAISSAVLGFDFNPTVDRIRLVTAEGQNLRLNPETGKVAFTDGSVNGASNAAVTAVAYTQNRAGATGTVLFDIDIANDKLFKQSPPNDGTLVEVGSLGVNASAAGGFDISPDSTQALAALTVDGASGLYSIDLSTGAATKLGDFNNTIRGIAIPTDPVAYAVSGDDKLLILNPNTGTVSFTKSIGGLQAGEHLVGLDIRPATGQLFALSTGSRLYTLNASTGMATQVGSGTFSTALTGTSFGFDFNPTVDRIRVVSDAGQNLRLNPTDGTVAAVDGTINPSANVLSAAAYTNNFAGATTTALFDIDAEADHLVKQAPPNDGTITDIGALGVNIDAANGFDIAGVSGAAVGIFTVNGTAGLYSVDLATGAATAIVPFANSVTGFTLGLGL